MAFQTNMQKDKTLFLYSDNKIEPERRNQIPWGVVYHRFDDGESLVLSLNSNINSNNFGNYTQWNLKQPVTGSSWRFPTRFDFICILRELCQMDFDNMDTEYYVPGSFGPEDINLYFNQDELCKRLRSFGVEIDTEHSFEGSNTDKYSYGEIWTLNMIEGKISSDNPSEEYRFYNPIPYAVLPVCNVRQF